MTKSAPRTTAPKPLKPAAAKAPTSEQIAQRAHEIYMARGGGSGQDFDDWLQAERELKAEGARKAAATPRKPAATKKKTAS